MNTCIDQPASGLLYGYMAYYLQSRVRGVEGQEYKGGGGCTKLPLHNAVCARFRYLYILSFPLLAFCTKMCYSRFKGDAVCAHVTTLDGVSASHTAKWQLAVFTGSHAAAAWLVWVDVSLSVVRIPLHHPILLWPSLPRVPPLCYAAAGLSHSRLWKPLCHESHGDWVGETIIWWCVSERERQRRAIRQRTTHTHKMPLICGTRPHPVFLIYAWR